MSWTLDASIPTLDSSLVTLDGWSDTPVPTSEFIWIPSYGAELGTEPKIREANFGDGYSQRAGLGINNIQDEWNLPFDDRSTSEMNEIKSFLRARNNGQSFRWVPYGEVEAVSVLCRKWSIKATNYDSYRISCVFERVYGE